MDKKIEKQWRLELGATVVGSKAVRFKVWAPQAKKAAVELLGQNQQTVSMQPSSQGYFEATVDGVGQGARYLYRLDDKPGRPDPVSRFQPEGVHAASAVVDSDAFRWTDGAWRGIPLKDLIIYEMHVGTFTREGTFDAIIPHLPYLKETVGITAIELLPVAQCPGGRNWGYDGVYPFAPQSTYGGPEGLKRLVDACHGIGIAVVMDVVYNHLGPEGNYLGEFGPYFTDKYRTPWGSAINYDGPDSDDVRRYIVSNALYWVTEYHIDALRLDAIHGIFDFSAYHILHELASSVQNEAAKLNRQILVIAESDLNDTRIIDSPAQGGYGLDGQWSDDFHHALRVVLTGESRGYYEDFHGLNDLGTAVRDGFVYSGQYSKHRRRRHGNSSQRVSPGQLVVFSQNHDQIGNRAVGDRLSTQLPLEAMKVARALVLLSPNIPLLFMGEEYGERTPFQYFIEHGDPDLIEAVRQGRRREFAHFGWKAEEIPDPQDRATFERSKINFQRLDEGQTALLRWTNRLIQLRKTKPSLGAGDAKTMVHKVWVFEKEQVLVIHRKAKKGKGALLVLGFNKSPVTVRLREPAGVWQRTLDSMDKEFGGTGEHSMPTRLTLFLQGTSVAVPAYTSAVFNAV